jgi:hypothetical protein
MRSFLMTVFTSGQQLDYLKIGSRESVETYRQTKTILTKLVGNIFNVFTIFQNGTHFRVVLKFSFP